MSSSNKALAFNLGGAALGVVLAALAVFGLVAVQSSASEPQKYSPTISYNSPN